MPIPEPLRIEHEELHRELAAAAGLGGRTGAAAETLAELLQPHFLAEERFALPPLGSLPALAAGRPVPDAAALVALAERLKSELPRMVAEHRSILSAIERLARAANEEGHPDSVRFAEKLKLHARTEEEVLYPAAVVVGEFLKRVPKPAPIQARWPAHADCIR